MSSMSNATSDEGSPSPDRKRRSFEASYGLTSAANLGTTSRKRKHVDSSTSDEAQSKRNRSSSNEFHRSSQSDSGSSSSSSDSDSESNSSPTHAPKMYASNHKSTSRQNTDMSADSDLAYGNKAHKMMAMMGYQEGKGLGKHAQGRVDPVEASKQRGRRGLGLQLPGLEVANLVWDSSLEQNEVLEPLTWLKNSDHRGLKYEYIKNWMVEGPRKETIDDETNFVDSNILKNVLNSKSIFDDLEPEEMRRARTKSNPFELIRGAFFLNRAAVKMANMDARTEFMFTKPIKSDGQPAVQPEELLYFADVCAGPGGFSEYVLWRKKWFAKGFGFTLRGECDFKLSDFLAGTPETFQTYYGVKDDGNVFDPQNIDSLKNYVLDQIPHNLGVHFMMADGGFSVDGKENIQEILSKQLYLCQCLVALSIVRVDGHFVVKLFDLFTPFSMGLMYLMYKSFKEISIMKPNTSRPANSERYLICKWRIMDVQGIEKYLFHVNCILWEYPTEHDRDINEIVPMQVMRDDEEFFNYFLESNNRLGERQIIGLQKIKAFYQDNKLTEPLQNEMRKECLKFWQLEDKIRKREKQDNPTSILEELNRQMGGNKIDNRILSNQGKVIYTLEDYKQIIGPIPYERIFMATAKGKIGEPSTLGFYLSLGGSRIYRYENDTWVSIMHRFNFALPVGTLIYGEIALEYRGEYRGQTNLPALHIIDAIFLGKIPVYKKPLLKRIELCKTFATAISQPNHTTVRVKNYIVLEKFHEISGLDVRSMKNGQPAMAVSLDKPDDDPEPFFYVPSGFIFLNPISYLWGIEISKTHQRVYYFKKNIQNSSIFDRRPDILGDFFSSFTTRAIWQFDSSSIECLHPDNAGKSDITSLHSSEIIEFIKPNLIRKKD